MLHSSTDQTMSLTAFLRSTRGSPSPDRESDDAGSAASLTDEDFAMLLSGRTPPKRNPPAKRQASPPSVRVKHEVLEWEASSDDGGPIPQKKQKTEDSLPQTISTGIEQARQSLIESTKAMEEQKAKVAAFKQELGDHDNETAGLNRHHSRAIERKRLARLDIRAKRAESKLLARASQAKIEHSRRILRDAEHLQKLITSESSHSADTSPTPSPGPACVFIQEEDEDDDEGAYYYAME